MRFGGIARLYGQAALTLLDSAHVLVIGMGGVGSWLAEALVRSGLGHITLMDLDDICITNTNRQLHTLCDTIGHTKTAVMAKRLLAINPDARVNIIDDFLDKENLNQYIHNEYSMVVDAIDNASVKAALIHHCKRHKNPIITVGSAGGKTDPTQITTGDLSKTIQDPLLAKVRSHLRRHYGFSRNTKRTFDVTAIYSTQAMIYPDNQGGVCHSKTFIDGNTRLDCSGGFGASSMVTGSFGLVAASECVRKLIKTQ